MLYGGYANLMSRVKDIRLKVIPSNVANDFVKKHHYSGKVVRTSVLHMGAFLDGRLHGVMSYGHSMVKSKMVKLVRGTSWNGFLELNRMAFDDTLPKNAESRCIAISMRLIKKNAPQVKWVISFADGTQCGDGTIYRAAGFNLIDCKKNLSLWEFPNGMILSDMTFVQMWNTPQIKKLCDDLGIKHKPRARSEWKKLGADHKKGFQLKYIYFIDPSYKEKLTVPILPFSKIKEMGASMYLGKKCDVGVKRSTTSIQDVGGGAIPTTSLHLNYA